MQTLDRKIIFFCLISLFLIPVRPDFADDKWKLEYREKFLHFSANLTGDDYRRLVIELVTVHPGITVATEFGHAALRFRLGAPYSDTDFYVDFGQYEMSGAFLWSLFRGHARFYVHALPMASAYEESDATARGLYTSELIMNTEQKERLIAFTRKAILDHQEGYEYHNYNSNCVTFIRDAIGNAYQKPLDLQLKDPRKNTGRDITTPFSDNNNWLRIYENILQDHDNDRPRHGVDLIFLPDSLLASLEQANLVKPKVTLLQHRLPLPSRQDTSGKLFLFLMVLIIISALPFAFFKSYKRKGEVLFALISGLAGTNALIVWLFTYFDFMDENIIPLVFSPLDFILLRNPEKIKNDRVLLYYGFFRLLMIAVALLLMLTIYPQKIGKALAFSGSFLLLYTWNRLYRKKKIPEL